MKSFEIDSLVRWPHEPEPHAVVTEILNEDQVAIRWLDSDIEPDVETCYVDDLVPYDPEGDKIRLVAVQAKVDLAVTQFEQAFQSMQEALELQGGDSEGLIQHDELLDLDALEEIFDKRGWSTSALYC